jgi:hypothetical protein
MSATYVDKTLTLDEMTLFGTSSKCVLGNGYLEMRMRPDAHGSADVRLGGAPTFDFAQVARAVQTTPIMQQSLSVQNGTWTCLVSDTTVSVTPLRQLPNCALQKAQVASGAGVEMTHTVVVPAGAFLDRYEHILLDVNGVKAPCLVVEAKTSYGRIAYAAVYLTQDATFGGASKATVAVTPASEHVPAVVNRFVLGASGAVDVLHCVVHGDYTGTFLSPDTPQTVAHAKSIAVQAHALCAGSAAQLRLVNTQRWAALWRSQIEVVPNAEGDADVEQLNTLLQMGMYRALSSFPDATFIGHGVRAGLAPGSEFRVAAALSLKPDSAHDALRQFDVGPDASLAELSLYVVNVWAVFRVTLDRVWLREVMPVVTRALNEITTRVQIAGLDEGDEVSGVGPTKGRRHQPLEDDAYTTILVKNALEMSIQASYELRLYPRREWMELSAALPMPVSGSVLLATSATGTAATDPEHVVNLHPFFFRQTLGTAVNVLTANKALADAAVTSADPVLRAAGVAVLTAYAPFVVSTSARADQLDALAAVVYAFRNLPASEWGFLGSDVTLEVTASVLACVVYGFARTRVTGQVSIDGIHTEKSGLQFARTASMPRAWKAIRTRSAALLSPENLTVNVITAS